MVPNSLQQCRCSSIIHYSYLIVQVQVNFLPVGHTHEDVDQLFSKIATEIRRVGAESIPGWLCCQDMRDLGRGKGEIGNDYI